MPMYLTRFSYTPETWARLVKNPEDRRAAARQYIESVGGTLHGLWYAFGDHDGYNLWEAPDHVSMAAAAIAIGAGGALSSIQTTVLLTVEETLAGGLFAALRPYLAPGAYVNYLGGDEGVEGLEAAYGRKLARLAAIKGKFDPANLFRLHQNIAPALVQGREATALA